MNKGIQCLGLILITCSSLTKAQAIKINFVLFDPCNSTYEHAFTLCSLSKDGLEYKLADTLGTIYLPSKGTYKLTLQFPEHYSISDSLIDVRTRGQNYDTLRKAKIIEWSSGQMHNLITSAYWCCDSLCNGHNVDYFQNGNKKVEGNFINGKPIGELKFYYSNGEPKEIQFYDKSGKGILNKKQFFTRSTPK